MFCPCHVAAKFFSQLLLIHRLQLPLLALALTAQVSRKPAEMPRINSDRTPIPYPSLKGAFGASSIRIKTTPPTCKRQEFRELDVLRSVLASAKPPRLSSPSKRLLLWPIA